jgi:hypothetical protein
MTFMNTYDIEEAAQRYHNHPVLGPATQTLTNLCDWANNNSDGWAYWPKPARAARSLMMMIDRGGQSPVEYQKALRAIKAFRTRQDADFEIVEVK